MRGAAAIARSRRIFALVGTALAIVVAIVVVIATTGGGGSPAPNTSLTRTQPGVAPPTTTPTPTTTTTTRVTLPPTGRLSRGDTGAQVIALQKVLATLGYKAGTPDGSFGSTTEAAVIKFQKSNGLTPDGIVGSKTAQAMNQALASKNS